MKTDKHIWVLIERLRSFYVADRAESVRPILLCWVEDPLKPKTEAGRLRINPLMLLLASLAVLATATFMFFSVVQP
jgi:hypothetical protein